MLLPGSKRVFFHLDCNSFFVSCEVLRDPSLRGKCACVGDEIVLSASYEARAFGVGVGTPVWEAEDILGKRFIHLDPDFDLYRRVSAQLMEWLAVRAPVEQFSIDEAFADVTGFAGTVEGYERLALDWQAQILRQVGVPVSVGCSNTRLKAKMLAEVHKPLGTCVGLTPAREAAVWADLPVGDIPFIGKQSQEKLKYIAPTVAVFCAMDPREVRRLLHAPGVALWMELRGYNAWAPRADDAVPQSISRTRSFNRHMTCDPAFLKERLAINLERAWEQLCAHKFVCHRISAQLRTKGFAREGLETVLPEPTSNRPALWAAVEEMFWKLRRPSEIYRGTGVTLSGLSAERPRQLGMEGSATPAKAARDERLNAAIEDLNRRYGRFTVAWGSAGAAEGVRQSRGLAMAVMEAE